VSPWRQLAADLALWLTLVALLVAFRALLLWLFRVKLSPHTGAAAFLRCFGTGLRFDISVATFAVLPSLLLTLIGFAHGLGPWHDRVRRAVTGIVLAACGLAFVSDVAYFAEYDDQFNHWIFGLIYDDRRAIWLTVWKGYPIITVVVLAVLGVVAAMWAVNKFWRVVGRVPIPAALAGRGVQALGGGWARALGVMAVIALAGFGVRASFAGRPLQLRDAARTGDEFLNKIVLNPFSALRYAIQQHQVLHTSAGLKTILPDGDIRSAATTLYPGQTNPPTPDACLERIAPGTGRPPPSHVFLVVLESYDAWAMQPEYAELHLTDELSALGGEGIQVRAFVSEGDNTMASLAPFIAGLPHAGVHANYQPAIRGGVPTSMAAIFKRLGYRPRFFYSGYLSWQRLGAFCREQGFEDIYGGDQTGVGLAKDAWGVEDEQLFRFVLEHTGKEPTFNLIMTTSYHAPFSVDVIGLGFHAAALKTNTLCRDFSPKGLHILGHLWYSDKAVGEFVNAAEQKLARPLFAVTGDHFSRQEGVSPRPSLFERKAVPLVLCGRRALERVPRPASLVGAHLDLSPTLVNLVAPEGFAYHAFGRDLLDKSQPQLGFGCDVVIGTDFIVDANNPSHAEDLHGGPAAATVPAAELALRYRRLHALGWWRVMEGNRWPATGPTASSHHP
jgi:phosphoglycerol transferase MdoB-like AlkP superfamily enzyme